MADTGGFDSFYASTVRRSIHHAYALTGDLAEAQDIAQEAYARAWQRWSTVSTYEDPEAWVRMVAWRLAANRWRGVKRWLAARSRLTGTQLTAGPNADRVAITTALRGLPPAQRRVVVLHHLYGLPVAEIASQTGMPVGTVKAYLSRARTALATLLKENEDAVNNS